MRLENTTALIDSLNGWNDGFQSGNKIVQSLQHSLYIYNRDDLWNDTLSFKRQVTLQTKTRFYLLGQAEQEKKETEKLKKID